MTINLLGTTAIAVIALSSPMGSLSTTWTAPVAGSGSATIYQVNDLAEPVAPCIIKLGVSNIAGMGVSEDISNTWVHDPSMHDIFWTWRVLGEAVTPFEQSANLQLQTHQDDKFSGQGKSISFGFDTPGVKTIECSAISITGETLTETFTITVRDPDVEYPNNRTICVSELSDWSGAPSGATLVTSLSAAQTAAEALNGQTHRVMLKYGETFTGTYTIDNSIVNARLTGFGTRADGKPVWTMDSRSNDIAVVFGNGNNCVDFVEHDIIYQGLWDPDTQSGYPDFTPCETSTHNNIANTCLATLNCEFTNIKSKRVGANVSGYTHALVDCLITKWRDYGIWQQAFLATSETGKVEIRGCAILQSPDCCVNNNGKTSGLTNDHGPLRIADARSVFIQQCYFFSNNSWGVGVQPSVRLSQVGSSGATTYGWLNSIYSCIFEGGGISCTAQNSGSPTYPGNHVFNGCMTIGTWPIFAYHMLMGHGGLTIRNHISVQFDIGSISAQFAMGIDNDGSGGGLSASTARCVIAGCTLMDLSSANHGTEFSGLDERTGEVVEGNITYQPNNGIVSHTNLVAVASGITPRNRGARNGPVPVEQAIAATSNGATLDLPLPSGMSDAEFDVSHDHLLRTSDQNSPCYTVGLGDFTVTKLGNGNVRLTNTSGVTWGAGTVRFMLRPLDSLMVDNAKYGTDTSLGSPTTFDIPRPGVGSDAIGAGSTATILGEDFLGATRPSAPAVGAVEPV